ncbi:copper chaperone PCu(A)C [Methylophilaceae bacterium]|nr:copper chaperone PCu(A)C [Methylophilaceae bacterium]
MIRHLGMKLSFVTLILISSIVFGADEIDISKAFIKLPRPGIDVTAGFATIKTNTDLKVMNVSNKNFKNIELHSMKMTYGVMEMRKLFEPKLGPNSPLVLSPGNNHLMLFGIKEKLKSGENLDLTFVFKDDEDNKIVKEFKFIVK